MDLDLTDKTIFVAGASRGIGLASARATFVTGTTLVVDGGQVK